MLTRSIMSNISLTTGVSFQAGPAPRPVAPTDQGNSPVTAAPVGSGQPVQDSQPTAVTRSQKLAPTADELKRITEELQRRVSALAPELQFSVDKSSGQSIFKFTDRTTHEIIRQFPSEETLQMGKELTRFQRGLLLNRVA